MNDLVDHPVVSAWAGSLKEVQTHLKKSHADRVVVVTVEHISSDIFSSFAKNLSSVATTLTGALLKRQDPSSFEYLAEYLTRQEVTPPHLLKEADMLVRARSAVLESGDWLSAAQVAQLAGLSASNPSAQPNKWKKQGRIFAISQLGVDYFPGYGLDKDANFRPVKALSRIIEIFAEHKDSWGMAFWFRSDNSFLGGKRPQDLLMQNPELVIAAANDEIQAISHG